jgi:hypothetical protein
MKMERWTMVVPKTGEWRFCIAHRLYCTARWTERVPPTHRQAPIREAEFDTQRI